MRSTKRLAAISTPRNSIDGERKNQARVVGETPRAAPTWAALTGWIRGWCSIAKGLVNGKQLTDTGPQDTPAPCRSEPARDGDLSADIVGECQCAIASRLTPTGDLQCLKILCTSLD